MIRVALSLLHALASFELPFPFHLLHEADLPSCLLTGGADSDPVLSHRGPEDLPERSGIDRGISVVPRHGFLSGTQATQWGKCLEANGLSPANRSA
jgi:hypothetical protein